MTVLDLFNELHTAVLAGKGGYRTLIAYRKETDRGLENKFMELLNVDQSNFYSGTVFFECKAYIEEEE